MAIEKNIVIGADLSGLETKLGELIDLLKTSQEQANKTSDQLNEINEKVDNIGKNSKNSSKSVKTLSDRFKGMGVAIKAAGIGLLLQAMSILKELFDNNQKTVDFFNTTFNTLQVAFSDFSKWVEANIGTFTGFFKEIFENPKEQIFALGRAIKEGVIARFEQLLEVFGYVGRALLAVVKGDFTGAMDAIKEAGKQSADVITGVDGSFEAVKETIINTAKAVANYTKETVKQGAAMTEANKQAEIAEVLAQGLIEKYDLQAERLRQVRDDERFTIEERIKANNDLKAVLEEQEEVMLANAQRIVDAKARQLSLDKDNIEFQKEYLAAVNELAGVQAQVAGFRSEQLMNEMALERELLELKRSRKENDLEIYEIEAQAAIEAEQNLNSKLILEEHYNKRIYEQRWRALKDQQALTKAGTQAFRDATNELELLEAQRTAQVAEETRKRTELERASREANLQIASDAFGVLMSFNEIYDEEDEAAAKKAFDRNKKLQIGQAVINTAQGIMAQLAVPQDALTGQNFAKAAIVAATGAAQIAKIRSTEFEFAGDSGVDTSSLSAPSASPQFNIVGAGGQNAILESLQRNPVKAYVVGSDVTSQQELDRNRINQVSFP
jgi:ribosomal protein S8